MKKPNGLCLFRNEHIACIITGLVKKSRNRKTGPMLQVWIIPLKSPMLIQNQSLVCGDCKLMPKRCYVNKGHSVLAVHEAFLRGLYPDASAQDWALLQGKAIRFGAWGDPSFVPVAIWNKLAELASLRSGYTHQWNKPWAQGLIDLVMASVDSAEEQFQAAKMGWRTFRIRPTSQGVLFPDEIVCPSESRGSKCAECGLCNGAQSRAKSIVITAHGSGKGDF